MAILDKDVVYNSDENRVLAGNCEILEIRFTGREGSLAKPQRKKETPKLMVLGPALRCSKT